MESERAVCSTTQLGQGQLGESTSVRNDPASTMQYPPACSCLLACTYTCMYVHAVLLYVRTYMYIHAVLLYMHMRMCYVWHVSRYVEALQV